MRLVNPSYDSGGEFYPPLENDFPYQIWYFFFTDKFCKIFYRGILNLVILSSNNQQLCDFEAQTLNESSELNIFHIKSKTRLHYSFETKIIILDTYKYIFVQKSFKFLKYIFFREHFEKNSVQ